jgi:hypothetical protein
MPSLSSVAIHFGTIPDTCFGTLPDTYFGLGPKVSGFIPNSLSDKVPFSVSDIVPNWVSDFGRNTQLSSIIHPTGMSSPCRRDARMNWFSSS